ncbi:MAG: hypothetical protein QG597_5271 [Actinomycetota bacterium]|nr:hypothetical protein [Actinomycetota bacterium]
MCIGRANGMLRRTSRARTRCGCRRTRSRRTDVAALFEAMAGLCRKGEPTALAVLVAAYSGVRLGDLGALRGSDVDTRRRLIRVTRQVTEMDGVPTPGAPKGRKVRTTVNPLDRLSRHSAGMKTRAAAQGGNLPGGRASPACIFSARCRASRRMARSRGSPSIAVWP